MKIKAKNPNVASMKLIVPVDGIIMIDAEGVADVSPKCAAALVSGTNDWEFVSAKEAKAQLQAPKVDEDETEGELDPEVEEDEIDEPGEEGEEDEEPSAADELAAQLSAMTLKQMMALAEESGYPEKEWKAASKNKTLMTAYLIGKAADEGELDPEVEE